MFMQFLQTQAFAQATRLSITKSKCTPESEIFSEEEFFTKILHECMNSFGTALDLKITLNLNRILTPEARIVYTFSRTLETV